MKLKIVPGIWETIFIFIAVCYINIYYIGVMANVTL